MLKLAATVCLTALSGSVLLAGPSSAAPKASAVHAPAMARRGTTYRRASSRAGTAVRYALAHLRDSYIYGASGPHAFDCSGLTMMAWRAAGVVLPHNAAAQMATGAPVAKSQLRPGDLVFYYSPVHHVGIYIGHGKIVNAENPRTGVVVAPVDLMPYAGAVRVG